LIKVKNLTKKYGDQVVVNGISFTVKEHHIFGLLGPNGAGKTTTMEMMEGLRNSDDGSIEIAGVDAVRDRDRLKQIIGVQLQSTALFEHLTVRESLELYAGFYPKARPVLELLQSFDLQEKEKTQVKHLSGGQRQKLAIAIAVVHDPKVIFLDEPTTGLDPQARRRLWDLIFQLRDEGRTIVLSTHYMEEAEVLCDQVAIMSQGRMLEVDSPAGLIRGLASQSRIEFVLPDSGLDQELSELPGVMKVSREENEVVSIHTNDLSQTLQELVPWANRHLIPLTGLRTRSATLEDVFLHKTGERLRGK
jgi:ABC-2 type transport system ATP-binding protein